MTPRLDRSTRISVGTTSVTLGVLAVLLVARFTNVAPEPMAVALSFTPYFVPLSVLALLIAAALRHRVLSGLAAGIVLLCIWTQLPLFVAASPAAGTALRVGTVNLALGQGDAPEVVHFADGEHLDVLAVTELTPEARERLRIAGIDELLPHNFAAPGRGGTGTGIWSRHPLTNTAEWSGFRMNQLIATVVPPGEKPFGFAAIHPVPPRPLGGGRWSAEHARLRNELAARRDVTVVAGDFNATLDHAPLRRLQSDGFIDAAEAAGAGFVRTWPVDLGSFALGPLGPWVAIDHVLSTEQWASESVLARKITGTDHAAFAGVLRRR